MQDNNTLTGGLDLEFMKNDLEIKNPPKSEFDQVRERTTVANYATDMINNSPKPKDFSFNTYDTPVEQVYTKLNSGKMISKFPTFIKDTNNEERLARQQSTGEKWANGMNKLWKKTGTAVLGGTIGTVEGVINGISEGSLDAMYNSDFNQWLDDLNTKMDHKLPNYYTEQEKNAGFTESLGTANFWANDVTSGLSFTLGTIVSEGIWAAATGGVGTIAKGVVGATARTWGKAMTTQQTLKGINAYKEAGKTLLRGNLRKEGVEELGKAAVRGNTLARVGNNARFIATSAGYEAGVEARHYMKSTEENWLSTFQELNGRRPTDQEYNTFMTELKSTANGVFAGNMALVGASNFAMFGKILNGSRATQTIKNTAFKNKVLGVGYKVGEDGSKTAIKATIGQKIARGGYTFGKFGLLEGIEEGNQGVLSSAGENYMLDTFKSENIDSSIGLMDSMIKGFEESYGTKEGRKALGIGFIVGMFGGGVATMNGGGFSEFKNEQKNISAQVEYSNATTNKLLLEKIKEVSRQYNTEENRTQAEKKGDVTGEIIARKEQIYNRVIRDIRLGGVESGLLDLKAYLEKTTPEEMGLSKEDADQQKESILQEYNEIAKTTEKNLTYAEAILGDNPIAGAKQYSNQLLAEAMAHSLTLGEQSDKVANDMAETMKELVAENLGVEATESITVENALKNVPEQKKRKIKNLNLKSQKLKEAQEKLQKQLVKTQNIENKEDNTKRDNNARQISERLLDVTNQLEQNERQVELAFKASNISNISNGEVTLEMLRNQEESIQTFKENLTLLRPEQREVMGKLIGHYEKAVKRTKSFDRTIETFTNPKTRVSTLNGWLSKLINKNRKLDEGLEEYLKDIVQTYTSDRAEIKDAKIEVEQPANSVQSPKTEIEVETPIIKTSIQQLKDKVNEIVRQKDYLTTYLGDDFLNNPTLRKKDIKRFEELLKKISVDPASVLSDLNQKGSGLSKEETEEFLDLNLKLNDWKLIDGSGIGDLLKQVESLETEVEQSNVQKQTNIKEIVEAVQADESSSSETNRGGVNTIITPSIKIAKLNKEGDYEISHTNIESMMDIVPGSTILMDDKPIGAYTKKQLKKEGNIFSLTSPNGTIKITVGENDRLVVNKKDFDAITDKTETGILDLAISNFMPLYKNGKPVNGDFTFETVDGSVVAFNENAVNELESGDVLTTEVNLKDAYNVEQIEKYNRSKKTEKNKQELANTLSIYVRPKNLPNTIVGTLKNLKKSNSTHSSVAALKDIRDRIVDRVLESNENTLNLGIEIPVERVLLGNPNLETETINGKLVTKTIPFTNEATGQVIATGYALDGKILLNKDIEYNPGIAKRISERNKGQKIPTIVFKYGKLKVAYPVRLVETESDAIQRAHDILDMNMEGAKKGQQFIKFLQENKINPNEYNIPFQNEGWENSKEVQNVLEEVAAITNFADIETWLNKDFSPTNLIEQAQISVDITNRPLLSGKVVIKLEDASNYTQGQAQAEQKEDLENQRIALVEEISMDAIAMERDFQDSRDLSNKDADSDFLLAMYDRDIQKTPQTYMQHQTNVSILKEMFKNKAPKAVKEKSQYIGQIPTKLEKLDNIMAKEKAAEIIEESPNEEFQSTNENLELENFYENQSNAMELLGGIKSRDEFESVLEDSDMEFLKESYKKTKNTDKDLFIKYAAYDRISVKEIIDGELVDKTDSAKGYIEQVLTEPTNAEEFIAPLDFLLNLSQEVIELNEDTTVKTVVDQVLDNGVDIGIDLSSLKGESFEKLRPLFETLANYAQFQNQQTVDQLIEEYDKLFSQNTPQQKVTKVENITDTQNVSYIETTETEYQMYVKWGLLKKAEHEYYRIKEQDLATMYENLFQNKTKLPSDNITLQELKNTVVSKIKPIERPTTAIEPEILEKIAISKLYFGIESISLPKYTPQLYINPISNSEYLQKQYIADFNKDKIRSKGDKQELFYNNFTINENGIILLNTDPISMAKMEPYMDDNITNYLKITQQIPVETTGDVVTKNIERSMILDNPKILPIFEKDYVEVNDSTIRTTEQQNFIRLANNKIYENTGEVGQWNFYSELVPNDSGIKEFRTDTTAPELNIDTKDYEHLKQAAPTTEIKNKYNEKQSEDIDEQLECD